MSELSNFLTNEYPSHFNVIWDSATMFLRKETPASLRFEIEDKKETIIQGKNKGVSVIRRTGTAVEIIDLEEYTKLIHGSNHTPSSCDFVISPESTTEFIIFNELTRSSSNYILPFEQVQTGNKQIGKYEKAISQLEQTINRFYDVSDFCDQYKNKVALFSCRLSDKSKNDTMTMSAKSFSKVVCKKMRSQKHLTHGFVFETRIYDEEYRI